MNDALIKQITTKFVSLLIEETNKTDTQEIIKTKIIHPVINMIYNELYPYILTLGITIILILIFSLFTFIAFMMYYFKN